MSGTLYVVATPIGNLEDITLRALRVLKESDVVLCEDTRVTKKLLKYYNIETPTLSYHAHSGGAKHEKVLELLEEGKALALVSDAGTPTVSDPGARLVDVVREHFGDVVSIEAVPGVSAVTAALSVSGLSADSFTFLGFPPHKKGRETFFKKLSEYEHTVVFYESPHRIMKALGVLQEHVPETKKIVVVRELTKMYETVVLGTAEEVYGHFVEHPETVKGEFVVIVS